MLNPLVQSIIREFFKREEIDLSCCDIAVNNILDDIPLELFGEAKFTEENGIFNLISINPREGEVYISIDKSTSEGIICNVRWKRYYTENSLPERGGIEIIASFSEIGLELEKRKLSCFDRNRFTEDELVGCDDCMETARLSYLIGNSEPDIDYNYSLGEDVNDFYRKNNLYNKLGDFKLRDFKSGFFELGEPYLLQNLFDTFYGNNTPPVRQKLL